MKKKASRTKIEAMTEVLYDFVQPPLWEKLFGRTNSSRSCETSDT